VVWLLLAFSLGLSFGGCSPNNETPKSHFNDQALEACRSLRFDIRRLSKNQVIDLTECVSGEQKRLDPMVKILKDMDDLQWRVVVDTYNEHVMGSDENLLKLVSHFKKLEEVGEIKRAFSLSEILLKQKTAHESLRLFGFLLDQEPGRNLVKLFKSGFLELVEQNDFKEFVRILSVWLGSPEVYSSVKSLSELATGDVQFASNLESFLSSLDSFIKSSFVERAVQLPKGELAELYRIVAKQPTLFAGTLGALLVRDETTGLTFADVTSNVIQRLRKPLLCVSGNGVSLKIAHPLKTVTEFLRHRTRLGNLRSALSGEFPWLLSGVIEACDWGNSKVEIETLVKLSSHVVTPQSGGMLEDLWLWLEKNGLTDSLIEFVGQNGWLASQALVQSLFDSGILAEFLDATTIHVKEPEVQRFSQWWARFETLHGSKGNYWSSLRAELQDFLDGNHKTISANMVRILASYKDSGVSPMDLVEWAYDMSLWHQELPMMAILSETAKDEELFSAWVGLVGWFISHDQFESLLVTLEPLIASGDAEKIFRFALSLFESRKDEWALSEKLLVDRRQPDPEFLRRIKEWSESRVHGQSCLNKEITLNSAKGIQNLYDCTKDHLSGVTLKSLLATVSSESLWQPLTDSIRWVLSLKSEIQSASQELLTLFQTSEQSKRWQQFFKHWAEQGELFQSVTDVLLRAPRSERETMGQCFLDAVSDRDFPRVVTEVLSLQTKQTSPFDFTSAFQISVREKRKLKENALRVMKMNGIRGGEATFEKAFRAFSERGDNYFYDEGVYKRLSEVGYRSEVKEFFRSLLRYQNLEELVKAVQGLISRESLDREGFRIDLKDFDLIRYLDRSISQVNAFAYWPDANSKPILRLANSLDQLDILVNNSRFKVKLPLELYTVHEVGIHFQINIAKSSNLVSTMNLLGAFGKAGELYTNMMHQSSLPDGDKYFRFRNMNGNMFVLEDMAANKDLRFFQRMYQGMLLSTPKEMRSSTDPMKNQLYLVHRPQYWGFFARVSWVLYQLKERGVLEPVLGSLFQFLMSLDDKSVAELRDLITQLVETKNGTSLFDSAFIKLWKLKESPHLWNQFVTRFYQYVAILGRFVDKPTSAIKVIQFIASDREVFDQVFDFFVDDMSGRDRQMLPEVLVPLWNATSREVQATRLSINQILSNREDCLKSVSLALGSLDTALIPPLRANVTKSLKSGRESSVNFGAFLTEHPLDRTAGLVSAALSDPATRGFVTRLFWSWVEKGQFAPNSASFLESLSQKSFIEEVEFFRTHVILESEATYNMKR